MSGADNSHHGVIPRLIRWRRVWVVACAAALI
jgi:hypothetical protein